LYTIALGQCTLASIIFWCIDTLPHELGEKLLNKRQFEDKDVFLVNFRTEARAYERSSEERKRISPNFNSMRGRRNGGFRRNQGQRTELNQVSQENYSSQSGQSSQVSQSSQSSNSSQQSRPSQGPCYECGGPHLARNCPRNLASQGRGRGQSRGRGSYRGGRGVFIQHSLSK